MDLQQISLIMKVELMKTKPRTRGISGVLSWVRTPEGAELETLNPKK